MLRRRFAVGFAALFLAALTAFSTVAVNTRSDASIYGGARRTLAVASTPEALALFAAMTVPPTAARAEVINATILELKKSDVWRVLDVLYVHAAADLQAALLNWKNPGQFTAVHSGGGTLTFEPDLGVTSDGTSYLDTGWNPATNGVNFRLHAAHLGIIIGTNVTDTNFDAGTGAGLRIGGKSGSTGTMRINSGTTTGIPPVATSIGHLIGHRREGSATQLGSKDGATSHSASAAANSSVTSANLLIAGNISSTFSARRIAAVHAGGPLTDAQIISIYNALAAYQQ